MKRRNAKLEEARRLWGRAAIITGRKPKTNPKPTAPATAQNTRRAA